MKKLLSTAVAVFLCLIVFSQNMVLHDPVSQKQFNSEKYSNVNGSPFLFDKWMSGTATVPMGTYKKVMLKFDAYGNTLFFNKDDEPFEFQYPIKSFILMPVEGDSTSYLYFKRGISGDGLNMEQFVQALTEGRVGLYKSHLKLLSDMNEINRGVVKTFNTSVRYFITIGGVAKQIKINKKELLAALQDKAQEVEKYMNDKKLSMRKESDLINVIQYYNSL